MELRSIVSALLLATSHIELASGIQPQRNAGGLGGFRTVPVLLHFAP